MADIGSSGAATAAAGSTGAGVAALAATFTCESIEESFRFSLKQLGLAPRVDFAPYNQVLQQFLSPSSVFAANHEARGLNIALIRIEDWARVALGASGPLSDAPLPPAAVAAVDAAASEFVQAARQFAASSKVPLVIALEIGRAHV
mgnify:CR=1 FL=1